MIGSTGMGVEVRTGAQVEHVDDKGVIVAGRGSRPALSCGRRASPLPGGNVGWGPRPIAPGGLESSPT